MARKGSGKRPKAGSESIIAWPRKGESKQECIARVGANHPGVKIVYGPEERGTSGKGT